MHSFPTPSISWSTLNPDFIGSIPARSSRASGPSCERRTSARPFSRRNVPVAATPNIVPMPRFSFGIMPSFGTPSSGPAGSDHSTSPAICAAPSPSGSGPPFDAAARSASVPGDRVPSAFAASAAAARRLNLAPSFFFAPLFLGRGLPRNRPPWSTRVFAPICAARGSAAPTRMNLRQSAFPAALPYFTWSSRLYPYTSVQNSHSWLPRRRKTWRGAATFHAIATAKSSAPHAPRSTKSPLNTNQFVGEGSPASRMSFSASWSWPWVSPTTTTRTPGPGSSLSSVGSDSRIAPHASNRASCVARGNTRAREEGGSPPRVFASRLEASLCAHSGVTAPPSGQAIGDDMTAAEPEA